MENGNEILNRSRRRIEQRIQELDKEQEKTQQYIGSLILGNESHPNDLDSTVIMAIENARITVARAKKDTSLLVWVLGLLKRKG